MKKKMDILPPAKTNNIFLEMDTSKVVAERILSPEEPDNQY